MRYRVSLDGFLERFVRQKGKGEVWEAMWCPFAPPMVQQDPIDKDLHPVPGSPNCGNWCPLFEGDWVWGVRLHCGAMRKILIMENADASEDREP